MLAILRKKAVADLAELMDLVAKSCEKIEDFQALEEIHRLLPEADGVKLLKNVVKNCQDLRVYELLAQSMEDQEDIPKALLYWVGADNFRKLLRALQVLIDRGNSGEKDLFVCRTVLMLLTFRNSGMAKHLLAEFRYLELPIINFSKFLIQAVESGEKSLVTILKEKYARWIARDPSLAKYLQQIEKVYFNRDG